MSQAGRSSPASITPEYYVVSSRLNLTHTTEQVDVVMQELANFGLVEIFYDTDVGGLNGGRRSKAAFGLLLYLDRAETQSRFNLEQF